MREGSSERAAFSVRRNVQDKRLKDFYADAGFEPGILDIAIQSIRNVKD